MIDRLITALRSGSAWLHRHQVLLWWAHTLWALAWGAVFMWLGARQFAWLRWAFVYIAFIWASSFVLPRVLAGGRLAPARAEFLRGVVNYFNKNFYQQLLIFVLPIYAASVTLGSANMLFVAIVAVSALLATIDLFYDRHLSASRALTAVFFAFNLFVILNVALPVLWSMSNHVAMRLSAALALLGFMTLRYGRTQLTTRATWRALLITAALLAMLVEWGRPLIPPAPLRMASAQFGLGIDRQRLVVTDAVATVPAQAGMRVYAISAIVAPLGLNDRIRHRWTQGTRTLSASPYYSVTGGRAAGYRLWTSTIVERGLPVVLWIETEAGQTIGRATLSGK